MRLLCAALIVFFVLPAGADGDSALRLLHVGTSGDYAPFTEREGGTVRGFDIDVAKRFAADTGRRIEWVPFVWPELMAAHAAGRFDVAMSGVTIRVERSVQGRFSVPVAENGAVVLVHSDAAARLEDASLRIGVNAGGHLERVTRARFGQADIRAIPSNARVRAALAKREVDAVVTDTLEAPHWLEGLTDVRQVGPFTRDRKAYWLPAAADGLAAELDGWLVAREADGTLASLRVKWFGAGHARTATPLRALLGACDERLALMPAVAEWKRSAGADVVDAEREKRVVAAGVAPPARVAVEAFYRAQIDAAVAVQRRVLAQPTGRREPQFDLASELRPALLRIGERIARLLVDVAAEPVATADLAAQVTSSLERHALDEARRDDIARALAAF
jgi:cyclohexadienyl dehydratase